MTKALLTIFGVFLTSIISASTTFACDCVGPGGKRAMTKVSVVFSGKVKKIEYLEKDSDKTEPKIKVTFVVSRVWQGDVRKSFVIHTTENKWSCSGYYFSIGSEYLVVAYPNDDKAFKEENNPKTTFGTNPCGATKRLEAAGNELLELGKGKRPKG